MEVLEPPDGVRVVAPTAADQVVVAVAVEVHGHQLPARLAREQHVLRPHQPRPLHVLLPGVEAAVVGRHSQVQVPILVDVRRRHRVRAAHQPDDVRAEELALARTRHEHAAARLAQVVRTLVAVVTACGARVERVLPCVPRARVVQPQVPGPRVHASVLRHQGGVGRLHWTSVGDREDV